MKSSIRSRSMKLLGLAAKVGREELAQTLKEKVATTLARGVDEIASGRLKTRVEQARLIAENLSQLKGAAMKAGQLLSLDASDYFPPEAVELLSKLQGKADPHDFDELRAVMVEELGEARVLEFESINPIAAASASIGQVHRARLLDQNVAVKIQYPGVSDSIDSDLKILQTIAQSFVTVTGRRMNLNELFAELAIVLKQEADYRIERENMKEYARRLVDETDFVAPVPVESHCSQRVLTMSWMNGVTVSEWLCSAPSHADRTRLGRMVLDLYCKEFFEWGFVQTDPNYANFLVQTDPLRLVVLDFGATLRYSEEFRRHYVELLKALGSLDRARIIRAFSEFGAIDPRESDETREHFADLLILSLEPFQPWRQPFRFRDDDYAKRSKEAGQKFVQSLKYSPPPRKILFLHRKLGGVFSFLKTLDVQIDIRPYWERMVSTSSGSSGLQDSGF